MNRSLIYLTGFMGSGKSTIGSMLAQTLDFAFLDLDNEIESVMSMSIPEIFRKYGEHGFRDIERHALDSTVGRVSTVVSLGGGAAVTASSTHVVQSHGVVVYLKHPVEQLVERLSKDSSRPLLAGRADLKQYVEEKLNERRTFYESSEYIIECEQKGIDDIVAEVVSLVSS